MADVGMSVINSVLRAQAEALTRQIWAGRWLVQHVATKAAALGDVEGPPDPRPKVWIVSEDLADYDGVAGVFASLQAAQEWIDAQPSDLYQVEPWPLRGAF